MRTFLPTTLAFLAFIATVVAYVVLAIQGSPTGPLETLMTITASGALGLAAPSVVAKAKVVDE